MDQTTPRALIPWRNRYWDLRSLTAFGIVAAVVVLAVSWVASVFGKLAQVDTAPEPITASYVFLLLLGLALDAALLVVIYFLVISSSSPRVPFGHKALIRFLGHFTNEIAGSGQLTLPFGYTCTVVGPTTISVNPQDVMTKSGHKIKAAISAQVRIIDYFKHTELAEAEKTLIASLLQAELRSVFTHPSAPFSLSNLGGFNAVALESFSKRLKDCNYGLACDSVDIDIRDAPACVFQPPDKKSANTSKSIPEIVKDGNDDIKKIKKMAADEDRPLTQAEEDTIETIERGMVARANKLADEE